ncbi:hypothetical protein DFH09DRAFT_1280720 [Mycena vulgaris]|nr:hypothetical protein DFH09DRAFT_1280720 [Mycena vulgaris]
MDADRISDGMLVALKRSNTVEYPQEVEIVEFFSIPVPDLNEVTIIVMPLLYALDCPELEMVGEVMESFRQIFERFVICPRCALASHGRRIFVSPVDPPQQCGVENAEVKM